MHRPERSRRAWRFLAVLLALAIPLLVTAALAGLPRGPSPSGGNSSNGKSGALTGDGTTVAQTDFPSDAIREGRDLFVEGCAGCHGTDARGLHGRGPSLIGAGALAADFYLRTGRMPLGRVGTQPLRAPPAFSDEEIEALVAYVGSLGGPEIPEVHPEDGDLAEGMRLFNDSCAGCHATTGKGGVVIGAYAPPLGEATPTQVAEAIRIGPNLMPRFSEGTLSDAQVDSLARYVQLTQNPDDRGGWGIGHIGPVPEGLVAWFVGIAALLIVARLVGERAGDAKDE